MGTLLTTNTKVKSSSFDEEGFSEVFTDTGEICSQVVSDQGVSDDECVSINLQGQTFRAKLLDFTKIRSADVIWTGKWEYKYSWSDTKTVENLINGYSVGSGKSTSELTSGNIKKYNASNDYTHSHFYFSAKVEAVCELVDSGDGYVFQNEEEIIDNVKYSCDENGVLTSEILGCEFGGYEDISSLGLGESKDDVANSSNEFYDLSCDQSGEFSETFSHCAENFYEEKTATGEHTSCEAIQKVDLTAISRENPEKTTVGEVLDLDFEIGVEGCTGTDTENSCNASELSGKNVWFTVGWDADEFLLVDGNERAITDFSRTGFTSGATNWTCEKTSELLETVTCSASTHTALDNGLTTTSILEKFDFIALQKTTGNTKNTKNTKNTITFSTGIDSGEISVFDNNLENNSVTVAVAVEDPDLEIEADDIDANIADLERRSLSYLTRKISQAFGRKFYSM